MKGSMNNRFDEGKQFGELFVGMGATAMYYSDREPFTVQKIISDKRVIVTADKYTRVDDNGMSDCQNYEYESVPLFEEKVTGCTHMIGCFFQDSECPLMPEGGCGACQHFKEHTKTNGVEIRKCKNGWKAVGKDVYFTLGIRERYFDYSF